MPFPLDLARRMIAIDSVTSRGTLDLAKFCAEEILSRTDLDVSIWPGDSPSQVNLIGLRGLGAKPPILLNSHLDTAPPGDPDQWTACGGDPLAATHSGDRLFGLGAADAKLDWLCKALALERVRSRPCSRGIIFAGTFGEESGLRGARALLPRLPERPVAAWAGEPTALTLVTRHKGLLVVTVEARAEISARAETAFRHVVQGKAAHSSTPHLGDNAILKALRLARDRRLRIAALHGGDAANKVPASCVVDFVAGSSPQNDEESAGFSKSFVPPLPEDLERILFALVREADRIASEAAPEDPSFSPPHLTWNLGRVEAAGGTMRAALDFRYLPGDRADRIVDRLEAFLTHERRERATKVSLTIERNNPPLDVSIDSPAVTWSLATLAELGLATELGTKAGCTEAGFYAAAGIPSVVFGPGRAAGNIHAPNEWTSISELEKAVDVYTLLLEKICTS